MTDPLAISAFGGGLFSPEEQRRLMWAEFERARRYGHPVGGLVIGIDRLGQLQDLYGRDSKHEIFRAVLGGLRADTRLSDFLASLVDDRLLMVLPHAPLEGVRQLARRIQKLARRLQFRGDSRSIEIGLSIGLCHGRGDELLEPETFLERASKAQRQAASLGGDRVSEAPAPRPGARRGAAGGSEEGGGGLSDLVLRLQESGESASLVAALLEVVQERGAARAGQEAGAGLASLERQVEQMAAALAEVQRVLASLDARSGAPGAATALEARVRNLGAVRQALMDQIFRANTALREQIGDRQRGAAGRGGA